MMTPPRRRQIRRYPPLQVWSTRRLRCRRRPAMASGGPEASPGSVIPLRFCDASSTVPPHRILSPCYRRQSNTDHSNLEPSSGRLVRSTSGPWWRARPEFQPLQRSAFIDAPIDGVARPSLNTTHLLVNPGCDAPATWLFATPRLTVPAQCGGSCSRQRLSRSAQVWR